MLQDLTTGQIIPREKKMSQINSLFRQHIYKTRHPFHPRQKKI